MPTTVLIADLHLSDDEPALTDLLLQSLKAWQQQGVDALYILGDLFDVWVGDDALSACAQQAAAALKAFSQTAPVYFIAGNRDFLLGSRFAEAAGMRILPAVQRVDFYGRKVLLMHGDELCSDDRSYQRYRRVIRAKWLTKLLLKLPLRRRLAIAERLRQASLRKKQRVGLSALSDATETGVQAMWQRYPETDTLIHGHTHRPNRHTHCQGARTLTRFVLPDWRDGRGGCLLVRPDEAVFQPLAPISANPTRKPD